MQGRSIILADHSGTAHAKTHSQRFLHIWPLRRNIIRHMLFVIGEYTGENNRTLRGMRAVLEGDIKSGEKRRKNGGAQVNGLLRHLKRGIIQACEIQ